MQNSNDRKSKPKAESGSGVLREGAHQLEEKRRLQPTFKDTCPAYSNFVLNTHVF